MIQLLLSSVAVTIPINKRVPSIEDLERIANVLNTSLSYLLAETSQIDSPSGGEDNTEPALIKKRGERINLDTIYAALKSVMDGAIYTRAEDRAKAEQLLRWALEELESAGQESPDISDNAGDYQ